MWTRVVDLENTEEVDVGSFEIDEDLLEIDEEPGEQPEKGKEPWKPLFHSKDFWKDHPNKQLDHYVLEPDQLFKLATKSCQHRQMFLDRAEAIDIENGDFLLDAKYDSERQGRKVRSRGTNPLRKENEIKPSEYRNPVPIG